jgi:hypothetical protein
MFRYHLETISFKFEWLGISKRGLINKYIIRKILSSIWDHLHEVTKSAHAIMLLES